MNFFGGFSTSDALPHCRFLCLAHIFTPGHRPIVIVHVGVLHVCTLCAILLSKEPAFSQDPLLPGKQGLKPEMILCQVAVNNTVTV